VPDVFDQAAAAPAQPDVFDMAQQDQQAQSLAQMRAMSSVPLQPNYQNPGQSILQRFARPQGATTAEQAAEAAGDGGYRLAQTTPPPQTVADIPNEKNALEPVTPTLRGPETPNPAPMREEPWGTALSGVPAGMRQATPEEQQLYAEQQAVRPTGLAAGPRQAAGELWRGTGDVVEGANAGGSLTPLQAIALGKPIEQPGRTNVRQMERGGTEMIQGAMGLGTPLFAEGVAAAPIKMFAGYYAGVYAGKGAALAAKAAGLSPEAQEFANTLAFFLPTAAAVVSGIQTGDVNTRGIRGKALSLFGGRVQAGFGATDSEMAAGARVGSKQVSISVPRGPVDPVRLTAVRQISDATAAMAERQRTEAAAAAIVQGVPPAEAVASVTPKPPAPPMPQGMDQGILTPDTIQNVAKAIAMAATGDRPGLVMEAHENLAKWMAQQGRVIVNGEIHIVKTPEQAQTLAAKLVNTEVARQDTIRNQPQPEPAAQPAKAVEQQKPNEPAEEPEGRLYQRAQTLLDSSAEAGKRPSLALIQRQLRVGYGKAQALINQWQQEKSAASIPTVGAKEEPVVEESRATVDAQMSALRSGNISVVMLPQGSGYKPAIPDGFKAMDVRKGPGAGTYVYNPKAVKPATIRRAAENGTHGDLLGHVQTKEELAGKRTTVVQASAPDGTPIQDSEVDLTNPQAVHAQAATLAERHPGAAISVKPTGQVIKDRLQRQGGDVFDKAAENSAANPTKQEGGRGESPELAVGAETRPASLSEQSVDATMDAARKVNPASRRSDEQQRTDAERDIAVQKEQARLYLEYAAKLKEENRNASVTGTAGRVGAVDSERSGEPENQVARDGEGDAELRRGTGKADGREGDAAAEEKPSLRAGEPVAGSVPEQREHPAGEQPERPGAAAEVKFSRTRKGDVVRFLDRDGNERSGTVKHSNALVARIKAEDGKEYNVSHKKVLGPAESTPENLDVFDEAAQPQETVASPEKEAQNDDSGDERAHSAGDGEAGGGRPAARAGGADRNGLEEVPQEVLPEAGSGRDAEEGNPPDRADVRGNPASVPESGPESGSGAGSDSELDSTPGGAVVRKAVRETTRPKALNRGWYVHPDNWHPPSGTVGRLEANLKAIRILRDIEKKPRRLADEERDALANYVGWGALQHAFDPWMAPVAEQARWKAANSELQKLLSPDEMARAQESTKNAHYTSPELVRFMWDTAQRFGFKAGNVLEPAVGTGNFLGMMPKSVRAKVNAVINEMDTVSFGIARLLYPEATAFNKDFADLILPDDDVDLAIGNPPFGGYKLYDPKYKKLTALVHDFFFVKSLDKVRPGGVLAFITSTGTMDKADSGIRTLLASKSDFLGAIRLPSGAFKANAGTDVTTDLIFLLKRAAGQEPNHRAEWLNAVPQKFPGKHGSMETLNVNEYFQQHPEMMLGKPTASTKMYGGMGFVLEAHEGSNIEELLKEAQKKLPRGIISDAAIQEPTGSALAQTAAEFAPDNVKEGQYTIDARDNLKQRIDGKLVAPEAVLDKAGKPVLSKIQRFKALVGVRDSMNRLLGAMLTQPGDDEGNGRVAQLRGALEKEYNAFAVKYGYLNGIANNAFRDDPHYPRLLALENWDRAARKGTRADIFRRRTIFPREELKSLPDDPKAALQLVLAERGFPDVQMMARLRGDSVEDTVKTLRDQGLIYRNPASGQYQTRETYLSGYVRDKLRDAKKAVAQGVKEYAPNVAALEKVIPADIEIGDDPRSSLAVRLGSTWIPTDAIRDFMRDVFRTGGEVKYLMGNWKVTVAQRTAETQGEYGTPRVDASTLLELTLNQKQATVYDTDLAGNSILNADATTAAQAAQEKIRQQFQKWSARSDWKPELQRLYNDAYNNLAQVEYDGSHLTFPGMNPSITLKAHQLNAVWRVLQEGRALLAHEVGAGKTFEMAASIMEGRRVGTFKKPMVTVPNHIVEQFRKEFLHLYPAANLLVPTEKDFDAKNRQRIMSRIATGDFDAIILPHSQFNLMDISPERQRVTIQKQKQELRETVDALKAEKGEKRTIKQLETGMAKLDAMLKKLADLKADRAIYFDDTGVDALFVDEAHMYKNLSFYTKMTRVAGLQQAKAKSALRLKMKTEYLQDRGNGRGVIFSTGTPIQNTMAELYTMFKYVAPDVMERAGIRFFDDWAANFGSVITAMELSADGRSYKARSKFAQFQNVPELMNMFRSFADIKTAEDLDLPTPDLETGKPIVVPVPASPRLEQFVKSLMKRAEAVRSGKVEPKDDNMLAITTDGRKAATDMRLIDPTLPDDADSKINLAVDKMYEEWREGRDNLEGPATQMAFLDLYRATEPESDRETVNLYKDIRAKLAGRGIPEEQIAIIGEHDTRMKRQELFSAMNRGDVRVLLGSTFKMGAGTNAQRLLKALHHIDLTWRPGDLAQRNGRIMRQGNLNPSVRIYNYLTERSFDAYMAQTLQGKAEFISQVMSGRSKERVMSDIASEMVLSLEEMKIAASGNPDVKLQYNLQMQKSQLQAIRRSWESQRTANRQNAEREAMRAAKYEGDVQKLSQALDKIKAAQGEDGKGIHVQVDGKTFADRKSLYEHLDAMEVPPGNFHLTWNGIGIAVEVRSLNPEEARNLSGMDYTPEYSNGYFTVPSRSMVSLGRSIESRLRDVPDNLEEIQLELPRVREKARKLQELAERVDFPEQAQLDKVHKELEEVEKRLGMRSDVENAMAQAVSAEVKDDPEDDLLEDSDDEDPGEAEAVDDVDAQADQIEKSNPKPHGGTTLRASAFGLDLAAQAVGKVLVHEYGVEVKPLLEKLGRNLDAVLDELRGMVVPRSLIDPRALDNIMSALGEREKRAFILEQILNGFRKAVGNLTQAEQVAIGDRISLGEAQPTPELDKLAKFMRRASDETYRAVVNVQALNMREPVASTWRRLSVEGKRAFFDLHERAKLRQPDGVSEKDFLDIIRTDPEYQDLLRDLPAKEKPQKSAIEHLQEISEGALTYKKDYFGRIWKVPPQKEGAEAQAAAPVPAGPSGVGRGPLAGSKRFLKMQTLPTMAEGIERGGVPWSYNPIRMFERTQADHYRYITAMQIWRDALDDGARVFIPKGRTAPDGFEQVEDRIGDVRFPAASGEGMVEAGKWYLRKDYALALNHFLSKDWIRANVIGRGLMWAKNQLTAFRLGFSPFHALTTSVSSIASQAGLGLSMMSRAAREMDAVLAGRALKEIAKTPAAPVLDYRMGTSLVRYVSDPQGFVRSSRGQDLLNEFPGLNRLIDAAFTGGAKLALHPDERLHSLEAFRQAIAEKRAVAALFHTAPALNQFLMTPLFEYYIPRVKFAGFVRELSERIADRNADLGTGQTTVPRLARQTWDSVEDVFGQMNWDKFFWHNTFKAIVQLAFRAFTWFAGNIRLVGRAFTGQAAEILESMKYLNQQFNSDTKWGPEFSSTKAMPRLHPDMAKLLGLVGTFVLGNILLQKLLTGENPQDPEDYVAARIGGYDQYNRPRRVVLPAIVMKDAMSLWYNGATNYLQGKESDLVRGFADVLENEDFRHAMIHNPEDPFWKQRLDDAEHIVGSPIGVGNILRGGREGQPLAQRLLTGAGFSNAPYEMGLSRAERHMLTLAQEQEIPRTEQQIEQSFKQRQALLGSHTAAGFQARTKAREPELKRLFNKLTYLQARDTFENYATPEERRILGLLLQEKRYSLLRRNPLAVREADAAQ
jgi:N12 class adenine-specific DNA methylase